MHHSRIVPHGTSAAMLVVMPTWRPYVAPDDLVHLCCMVCDPCPFALMSCPVWVCQCLSKAFNNTITTGNPFASGTTG